MALILSGDAGITFPVTAGSASAVQASSARVLQVINATYSTSTSVSNATLVDTGLTATITPTSSSSKILILVNQNGNTGNASTADVGMRIALLRGASQIALIDGVCAYAGATGASTIGVGSASINYLDSPATTSATTYKTQFANRSVGATGAVTTQNTSSTSSITLLEIAA